MRNELISSTDEEAQHDIQDFYDDDKRIGFEILRNLTRGIWHNWHPFVHNNMSFDQEETENAVQSDGEYDEA